MWLGIFIAVVLLLIVGLIGIYFVGRSLPVEHEATTSITLKQSPEAAWDVLADMPGYTRWSGATSVSQLASDDPDQPLYRQAIGRNSFVLRRTLAARPTTLRFTIEDDSKFFSGSWTYAIASTAGGCTVTLTENGRVPHAIPRFCMHYLFGTNIYIRKQLAALARHFGEISQPT